jgi:hypothetical protein
MKIREISYKSIESRFQLGSYYFGKFCPAIYEGNNGYGIRIKTGQSRNQKGQSFTYDYFELDKTGLIITSPRGSAKEFNKKVRIVDIKEGIEKYKEKL